VNPAAVLEAFTYWSV